MPCRACPPSVPRRDAQGGRAHVFQARAKDASEAQTLIAKHRGYDVRQQVLGASVILLTFTRR